MEEASKTFSSCALVGAAAFLLGTALVALTSSTELHVKSRAPVSPVNAQHHKLLPISAQFTLRSYSTGAHSDNVPPQDISQKGPLSFGVLSGFSVICSAAAAFTYQHFLSKRVKASWAMMATSSAPDNYASQLSLLNEDSTDLYDKLITRAPLPRPQQGIDLGLFDKGSSAVKASAESAAKSTAEGPKGIDLLEAFGNTASKKAAEVTSGTPPISSPMDRLDISSYDSLIRRAAPPPSLPKLEPPETVAEASKAVSKVVKSLESLRPPEVKIDVVEAVTKKAARFVPSGDAVAKKVEEILPPAPTLPDLQLEANLQEALKTVNEATEEVNKTFGLLKELITGQAEKVSTGIASAPATVDSLLAAYQTQVEQIRAAIPAFLLPLLPEDPTLAVALSGFALLSIVVGLPAFTLWNLRYGGYSGDLTPREVQQMLAEMDALLLDIRSAEQAEAGVPDLRRTARDKALQTFIQPLPEAIRQRTPDPVKVEQGLHALTVASLRRVREAEAVVVMDSDGRQSRSFARLLREQGIPKSYVLEGGFAQWMKDGLDTRDSYESTLKEQLRQDLEAILQDESTPLGRINAFVTSDKGKLYLGLGAALSILILTNIKTCLQIAALVAATKLTVDAVTDRSYLKPRVGPDWVEPPPPKTGLAKLQEDAQNTIRQAKELQQSLAANITKLQFFMVRDLWDLPAGDALKLQEERRQRQPPPPPPASQPTPLPAATAALTEAAPGEAAAANPEPQHSTLLGTEPNREGPSDAEVNGKAKEEGRPLEV